MEESAGRAALLSGAGGVPPLRGRALRFVLVDELVGHADGMTVAEMVEVLVVRNGFDLGGRASKIISDALRWETRRGRVVRLGRGRYRFVRAARSTIRRIGILARRCRAWAVAIMRRSAAAAVPNTGLFHASGSSLEALRPPWADLRWLRNA